MKLHFYISFMFLFAISCIDEIDFKAETLESALVVEATITNEDKVQEIILSRTFAFEEDGPSPETDATVIIETNQGVFTFQEAEPGIYLSEVVFSAQENIEYQLKITTSNGSIYSSSSTQLTQATTIDAIYAERATNDLGENGMSIYLDSYDPTGNSKFYRYEYTETYKVIAPKWVDKDIIVVDDTPQICEVDLIDRTQEEQICYATEESLQINLLNTSSFSEDRVTRHLVRFISSSNYIISYRYSILVRQFVQSQEAFLYYETLESFSEEGSIFSQIQPGFFNGNIFSETNTEEKVIGFFDVSAVDVKRLFFDYTDFYSEEAIPPFFIACMPTNHAQFTLGGFCGPLITELKRDRVVYHSGASKVLDTITNDSITLGPFLMVLRPCGDCTALGSNVIPDFWVE